VVPVALKGDAPAAGTPVTLGIRPSHFAENGDASLPVTVDMLEHLGSETLIYARSASSDLVTIASQNRTNIAIGDTLTARFPSSSAMIFGADGKRIY
jgi:lactose/L-arabinose transport system ATP-binding protein